MCVVLAHTFVLVTALVTGKVKTMAKETFLNHIAFILKGYVTKHSNTIL